MGSESKTNLGERIRQLRKEIGVKQTDLCHSLGISQGTLSLWENGKNSPDLNAVVKICDIYGVTTDYLLGRIAPNLDYSPIETNEETAAPPEIIAGALTDHSNDVTGAANSVTLRTPDGIMCAGLTDEQADAIKTIIKSFNHPIRR